MQAQKALRDPEPDPQFPQVLFVKTDMPLKTISMISGLCQFSIFLLPLCNHPIPLKKKHTYSSVFFKNYPNNILGLTYSSRTLPLPPSRCEIMSLPLELEQIFPSLPPKKYDGRLCIFIVGEMWSQKWVILANAEMFRIYMYCQVGRQGDYRFCIMTLLFLSPEYSKNHFSQRA